MIKLIVFLVAMLLLISLVGTVTYDIILESKLMYVDELIKRGADITEVVRKL